MLRCFVTGNLWLFLAVVLLIGREPWRTAPTRYGFLGVGSLTPVGYNLVVAFCVIVAAVFLLLAYRTGPKS